MTHQFIRTELLIGRAGIERLAKARVAVFGIGGVGGYALEALARSGIGTLDLVDHDKVSLTNLNRQIIATHKTIGMYKTDAAKERILEINPDAVVNTYRTFYTPQTAGQFDFSAYDYIVDAIDTVTGKIALAQQAAASGTPMVSSMGAGNKMDASAFQAADIYETSVCPLAKVMRHELKKRGIKKLKVVYSQEKPIKPQEIQQFQDSKEPELKESMGGLACRQKAVPGSMAFVPSAAGLLLAGEVIKDLLGNP